MGGGAAHGGNTAVHYQHHVNSTSDIMVSGLCLQVLCAGGGGTHGSRRRSHPGHARAPLAHGVVRFWVLQTCCQPAYRHGRRERTPELVLGDPASSTHKVRRACFLSSLPGWVICLSCNRAGTRGSRGRTICGSWCGATCAAARASTSPVRRRHALYSALYGKTSDVQQTRCFAVVVPLLSMARAVSGMVSPSHPVAGVWTGSVLHRDGCDVLLRLGAGDLHFYMRHSFKPKQEAAPAAAAAAGDSAAQTASASDASNGAPAAVQRRGTFAQPQQPETAAGRRQAFQANGESRGKGFMRQSQCFADLDRGLSQPASGRDALATEDAQPPQQAQRQRQPSGRVPPPAAAIDRATIKGMYGDLLPRQNGGSKQAGGSHLPASNAGRHGGGAAAAEADTKLRCARSMPPQDVAAPAPQQQHQLLLHAGGFHVHANSTAAGHLACSRHDSDLSCLGGDEIPKPPAELHGPPAEHGMVSSLGELPELPPGFGEGFRDGDMPRAMSGDSLSSAFAGAPPFGESTSSDDSSDDGGGELNGELSDTTVR